jgi:hypothetical protein
MIDASAYFGPRGWFAARRLDYDPPLDLLAVYQHFPLLPCRNALSVGVNSLTGARPTIRSE